MRLKPKSAKQDRHAKLLSRERKKRRMEEGEWVRLPKPRERLHGLSRTTLLELCQRGKIRSAYIKMSRLSVRGIRLIHLPSLLRFLHSLAAAQETPVTPTKGI
jgi:hypothetical protein